MFALCDIAQTLKHNKMSKVKFKDAEKPKVSKFLSEQLNTLKTEKRIGRRYYSQAPDEIITLLENTIISIAEEIYTDN